ncbi:MAG: hypothetical protein EXS33_00085 [Pedosphaera sp.]|nr:hypothetical protein [Pedosphaera sp.]
MRSLDILVICVYLVAVVWAGLACRGKKSNSAEFFTGKGGFSSKLGTVLVGLSIAATLFSGLSFVIYTSTAYGYGAKIILGAVGIPIAWAVLRFWFLPRYLAANGAHPYDIIEQRFGPAVRLTVSAMFILMRIGWMGAMLAAPTLVVMGSANLGPAWFWPIVLTTGIACTFYTTIGGIRSVIITDAIQFLIIILSLLFIIGFILLRLDLSPLAILGELHDAGRLHILDFSFNFTETYTFWGVLVGLTISGLGTYLADMMMLQRYLAADSPQAAARAFAVNMWGAVIVIISLVTVGLLLWVWYQHHPNPLIPLKNDQVLAYFIARELPAGVSGLLIAAIMAATMSSMTSGIIAIAGTITNDWTTRFGRHRTSAELFRYGQKVSITIGVLSTLAGGFTAQLDSLFQVSQTVLGVFLGPMLGCMVLVVTKNRISTAGVLTGMALGTAAGWAVIACPVSFIWVAPVSSAFTIVGAHLLPRKAAT